ncbi:MAG: ATP-binding cassette domain-containing protein [Solidesulfovibrio sp.]|uniref:ATP-binding cassette domain-containing protein n=1 Tax=Solidesulfovibrio sp. TaxID=2910990 RepID=UPI002B1F0010|nr:ATP-binding cassette domain-containing protein [Solidesulfovibrio sp.]MEA4854958.1 hypothetical protein [Solidesulfovibrio sp.]
MDEKTVKLSLRGVSQSYVVGDAVRDAIVNISLDVYDNEFLVILGPGQCGKTVLLNIIGGLERPGQAHQRRVRGRGQGAALRPGHGLHPHRHLRRGHGPGPAPCRGQPAHLLCTPDCFTGGMGVHLHLKK